MLLESDTSLKVAHDIIHDANELIKKWKWMLADPKNPPVGSTVTDGYVEFEYSDGHIIRMPCTWAVLFPEGKTREKIVFRLGEATCEWKVGTPGIGSGVESTAPMEVDDLNVESLSSPTGAISIQNPKCTGMTAASGYMPNAKITNFTGSGTFTLSGNTYNNVDMPNGEGDLEQVGVAEIEADTLICNGEKIVPVEKINAWYHNDAAPETDGIYFGVIPFEALSPQGTPQYGFYQPLEHNPFYPDWVYVSAYGAGWNPTYAWVPSIPRPSVPYWTDSDGIHWHKVNVEVPKVPTGAFNFVWPVRTAPNGIRDALTVPPMKAEADGMIVVVKILSTTPVPICITDKYVYKDASTWVWSPGTVRYVKGPRICMFMAKRNITQAGSAITAIEYQFLPIGDLNG